MTIRNIGIMAHIDAGKTTSTERILYYTGKNHRIGEVDDGSASMDWMSQEQDRGITITSAATTCYWKGTQINIIDTPGHVDFTAEVERSLRVLDAAVAIFCAVGGVEPQSETVWRQANTHKLARIAHINKMDRTGANFFYVLKDIETKFQCTALAIQIPIGAEQNFEAIIDIIRMCEIHFVGENGDLLEEKPIRESYRTEAETWHENLINTLAHFSEELTELYLNSEEITPALIYKIIRTHTITNEIVPVTCGASLKNIGIQTLLDSIVEYLPAPDELPAINAIYKDSNELVQVQRSHNSPALGLIFKIQSDVNAGILAFIRMYSGSFVNGKITHNNSKDRVERIHRLYRVHVQNFEKIEEIKAGDIAVIAGYKSVQTGDTISRAEEKNSRHKKILLENISFPEPVISLAIEANKLADRKNLKTVLDNLHREDPTFSWTENPESAEIIIQGMGELHLDVIEHKILHEYKIPIRSGKPKVNYREGIAKTVTHAEEYLRTIAGKEQFAGVEIRIQANPQHGNAVISTAIEDILPKNLRDALLSALHSRLLSGVRLGYPCIDILVTIVSVQYDPERSSEFAFEAVSNIAFDRACVEAEPLLLEPAMRVFVQCPSEYVGEVASGISQRSGTIQRIESESDHERIYAFVALANMFGYSTALRSVTQGRASFSMEFSHFTPKEQ